MGIKTSIQSRFKSIESIVEELKNVQLAGEEIELFEEVNEVYEKDLKDVEQLNKKIEKATEKKEKADRKIMKIQNRKEKLKEKAIGPTFITLHFNKEYKMLKKQLKIAKQSRKIADKAIKALIAKINIKSKKLKKSQKRLKIKGKELKKIWKQYELEIKFISKVKDNKKELAKVYDKASMKAISDCIEAIRKGEMLETEISVKDLYNEINQAMKSDKKRVFSVVTLAKMKGIRVKELLGIKEKPKNVEEKSKEAEEKEESVEEKSKEAEEKEESVEEKSKEAEEKEESVEEKAKEVAEKEESVEEKAEEVAEKEENVEEKAEEVAEKEESVEEKVEEVEEKEESAEEKAEEAAEKEENIEEKQGNNEFKEALKENTGFVNSTVDRRIIEEILQQQDNRKLKGLTADEFMSYLGTADDQDKTAKVSNRFNALKNKDNKEMQEKGLQIFEEMLENFRLKSQIEISKMSKTEQHLYQIAKQYKEKEAGKKAEEPELLAQTERA